MSSSYQKKDTKNINDKDVLKVIERDPTGQYVRYDEILGDGSSKRVYKGFDEVNGIEIAWCKIEIPDKILKSNEDLQYLYSEADILKKLKHENIMICYHSWVDHGKKSINMITEFFTSGNLRQYRKKYNLVGSDNKAIKNWGRQILQGLDYLHCHDPPIIHRDLKCDNIFVNGNSGEVKIGDLGLAVILDHVYNTASGLAGTLEYMAPEVFEKDYNQSVDVYSFGLCLLELLTREMPYGECSSPNEVYKRVSSGVKPASLTKVTDPHVRELIQKCLGPASDRPTTSELLSDQFFAPGSPISARLVSPISDLVDNSLAIQEGEKFRLEGKMQRNDEIPMTLRIKEQGQANKVDFVYLPPSDTIVSVMEEMAKALDLSDQEVVEVSELMANLLKEVAPGTPESSLRSATPVTDDIALSQALPLPIQEEKNFRLEGKMQMNDAISMTLWIEKLGGQADKIQFVYSLESDTVVSVTEEMAKNLGLSAEEVVRVSELMDNLLAELAPGTPKSLHSASPVTDEIASSHTLQLPVEMKKFRLEGKMQMNDEISMTLWIEKLDGLEKAEFVYSLQSDTIVSISEEIAKNLGLSAEEVVRVSELMDNLLAKLVPA